jgi:hypothetical protein
MLPPFIIEQIRQREEEERRRNAVQQPRLELPLDYPMMPIRSPREDEEDQDGNRGVVILELSPPSSKRSN